MPVVLERGDRRTATGQLGGLPVIDGGRWIEPVEIDDHHGVQRPAFYLVGEVFLPGRPLSAVLRCSARGIYEAFVNGARIGDRELTPGFTAYRDRLQVQEFDVTDLVAAGPVAVGFVVSDGWFRGQHMVTRGSNRYGETVGVIADLVVDLSSTERLTFSTDGSWRSTASHFRADLMAGEVHDLRRAIRDWCLPGVDRSNWDRVRVTDHPVDILVPTVGPPVRRMEILDPISLRHVGQQAHVVDFGRNLNGWVRLNSRGPEGAVTTIEYGEWLAKSGDQVDNSPHSHPDLVIKRPVQVPFQTDTVISAGDEALFEPRHSTKGFRFVRVDGLTDLALHDVQAVVVRSDLTALGGFSCSSDDLVRLHDIAEWSFLTNACDIPTDCPTRERAGWTGDWQIFVETAAYLYDVTDFSRKWLMDLAADQLESGAVTQIVPNPVDLTLEHTQWWKATQGPAGWGDAAVHVPWEIHRSTGRIDVLEETYPTMKRWVEFAARSASSGRHPSRVAACPVPMAHEPFIWDTGFHFGDWNEPTPPDAPPVLLDQQDHGPTATAYLFRSALELSMIAETLGRREDAQRYWLLAEDVRAAWRTEFIRDGGVWPATQPNLVRALAFGLVPQGMCGSIVGELVRLIRGAGTHLGTGFLSTPFLLPVLADHGQIELAYELLLQRTPPSWLAMLDAGATTIWEAWDSVSHDGIATSSLNHFSMGAVISFLHQYVAGLRPSEPGYARFVVQPRPGGGLTWARTHHDSPFGRIVVAWQIEGDLARLDVVVPATCSADLILGNSEETVGPGRHTRTWSVT